MPVFHTKTIESILDPVAQQVSQLIILYEDAQRGLEIQNIGLHLREVTAAVENLLQVGQNLSATSKDEILKRELPLAGEKIENSCSMVNQAAKAFEPGAQGNVEDKHLMLDGARGILSGVSTLLLVWDESEIRKVLDICERIIEYLSVVEQVETHEEVATVSSNLQPGMNSLVNHVRARADDLIERNLMEMLNTEVRNTEKVHAVLISSMQMYVSVRSSSKLEGLLDAQRGRNCTQGMLVSSIQELKRILLLTSNSQVDLDELARIKRSLQTVFSCISDSISALQSTVSGARTLEAISSLNKTLTEGRSLIEMLPSTLQPPLLQKLDEIAELTRELELLQSSGKGESKEAEQLKATIAAKLSELDKAIRDAVMYEVVETFQDTNSALKALSAASESGSTDPRREERWERAKEVFEKQAGRMSATGTSVAQSLCSDPKAAWEIKRSADKLGKLTQQTVFAAKVVLMNPDKKQAKEHLNVLKAEWQGEATHLTALVDANTDSVAFADASEKVISDKLTQAEDAFKASNIELGASRVTDASKAAIRLVAVAKAEEENSSDPIFKQNLQSANQELESNLGPLVLSAKGCAQKPGNEMALNQFSKAADSVRKSASQVRGAMTPVKQPPRPPPPTADQLAEAVPEEIGEAPVKKDNPIGYAAHQLTREAFRWEERDNQLVSVAREMARMMKSMGKYTRGEGNELQSKTELINTSRQLAKQAHLVVTLAEKVAKHCTDKRMKRNLEDVLSKIPTISTQLKIVAAVKAASISSGDLERDQEASEMLTINAENLMDSILQVIRATESASIRVPPEKAELCGLKWVNRDRKGQTPKALIN
eukprot:TRINITY_DN3760_c0_g1_i6.p1 TRINITY_DN3760_c0_g1~~TRINITY_DN3760_c0_g1_i6.p1  ORF type:complete len:830 (-),score=193.67 TRINITY_DN3760_c0_g1_i6:136-2625(-)